MNKKDYHKIFPKFAKASVKLVDGEINLTGKCALICRIGEIFDVYVCNAKKRLEGDFEALLSARKVTNIIDTLPKSIDIHKLDGEMWFQTPDVDWLNRWLWENRKSLGLRQRGNIPAHAFHTK